MEPLVQYIVVRTDVLALRGWTLGSVIAQGCHAAVDAIWQHREHELTRSYCDLRDRMHTVVLDGRDEAHLTRVAERLTAAGVRFVSWREHPENMFTALATAPDRVDQLKPHFRGLTLLKNVPTGAVAAVPAKPASASEE